jgi:excisionase family DNA binding protein
VTLPHPNSDGTPAAPQLLLTARAAAVALSVSARTLWAMTHPRGPLPAIRIGRAVRYSAEALRAWIAAQQRGGHVMSLDPIVTLDDLEAAGLTAADVRRRGPHAVAYTALDGRPCWPREDLDPRLDDTDGRGRP